MILKKSANDKKASLFPWRQRVQDDYDNVGHKKVTNPCPAQPAGGYKTFSMLNSAEHEIYPAHKC